MVLYDCPLAVALVWLFVLGAAIGSFLNVCIFRIPQHDRLRQQLRGLWSPPSSCPNCRRRIPGYDNVPILGWIKLGGRCRFCRCPISIRYPTIELCNGLMFVLVYWLQVPAGYQASMDQSAVFSALGPPLATDIAPASVLNWRYLYHMVLLECLLVATFIDIDLRIIPDASTVPGMCVGVLMGAAVGHVFIVPVWFQTPRLQFSLASMLPDWCQSLLIDQQIPHWISQHPHWHGLCVSIAGLIVGGGMIWTVRIIGHWVLRREAMGFGDVVLMALIGSFLGWQPTVVVFFLAPLCAVVVVGCRWLFRRESEIPYGPYLSFASLLVVIGWRWIAPIAEPIFDLGPLVPVIGVAMAIMLYVTLQALQMLKWMLGIPLYPDPVEWHGEWRSSDQLWYFSGETVDDQQGRWRVERWDGILSGRGMSAEQRWRGNSQDTSRSDWGW